MLTSSMTTNDMKNIQLKKVIEFSYILYNLLIKSSKSFTFHKLKTETDNECPQKKYRCLGSNKLRIYGGNAYLYLEVDPQVLFVRSWKKKKIDKCALV